MTLVELRQQVSSQYDTLLQQRNADLAVIAPMKERLTPDGWFAIHEGILDLYAPRIAEQFLIMRLLDSVTE